MGAIATPVFGCKSHINANRRHGFVRTWIVTDAARHDGRVPGELPDQANTGSTATGSTVRADTAYRSQKNDKKIARAGLTPKVHFRRPPGKPMPVHHERANAARSKVRSAIEHPFVGMKTRMGLFVRTIGIDRARARIAVNMKRLLIPGAQRRRGIARPRRNQIPNHNPGKGPTRITAVNALSSPDSRQQTGVGRVSIYFWANIYS